MSYPILSYHYYWYDRIGPAEYTYAEGAFRSGKYKIILNQGCTGWYTFDSAILEEDPLTDTSTVCEGHPCSSCGGGGCGKFYDYLFDVEADPREENNLIDALPEVSTATTTFHILPFPFY